MTSRPYSPVFRRLDAPANRNGGADPRSARDALVPLFARRIKHLRHCGRPTRASAADQGVRPTICAEWSRVSKLSGIWASTCATNGPRRLRNVD